MARISLVVGTLGRVDELRAFAASLAEQAIENAPENIEVIVIDQNADAAPVAAICAEYAHAAELKHIRSEKGLSRARNVGLKHVTGDIVAFPDDDCLYPAGLLQRVFKLFDAAADCDGFIGASFDRDGNYSGPGMGPGRDGHRLSRGYSFGAISYTIFLRRRVVDAVGGFDESLGVGAGTQWGSGEETDYVIRAIDAGFHLHSAPALRVIHPRKSTVTDAKALEAAYRYGLGQGHILKKHKIAFPVAAVRVCLPIARAVVAAGRLRFGQSRYFMNHFAGRYAGWRHS